MPALASPASEPLRLPSLHKHTAFLPESTSPMGGEEGLLLLYNNEGTKRDMLTVCLSSTSTLVNLVKVFSEWYNAYHLYLTSTWLSRLAYPDPGESPKASTFSFPDRWVFWRWHLFIGDGVRFRFSPSSGELLALCKKTGTGD